MREILFRGQTDTKGWVLGDYNEYPNAPCSIRNRDNDMIYRVYPETVGQYTGLTDVDGKKIFEGDIVNVLSFTHLNMAVGFLEGGFCLVDADGEYLADIHYIQPAGEIEGRVIGNIFNNPELMKRSGT